MKRVIFGAAAVAAVLLTIAAGTARADANHYSFPYTVGPQVFPAGTLCDATACVTMSLFHERLADGVPAAEALHGAQNAVRALSGAELSSRYVELGGDARATASSRRRGAPSAKAGPELPLDPEFVDDLADAEPVDILSGEVARVWAPFVVIGA
jgi:hypothetical protein